MNGVDAGRRRFLCVSLTVGGALLLGEVMTTRAYIGCALIFIGTVLAQVPVKIPRLLRKRE